MPNLKKPWSVSTLYGAKSYQRIISRQGEIGEKIRAYHGVQNTSNSQRRTSQMIRSSPTAYECRIYVLTITLRKTFLVVHSRVQIDERWFPLCPGDRLRMVPSMPGNPLTLETLKPLDQ